MKKAMIKRIEKRLKKSKQCPPTESDINQMDESIDKRVERMMATCKVDSLFEYRKWMTEIPAIQFHPNWKIRIIPPFMGAIVRFQIEHVERPGSWVSVYLDCYGTLGCYGDTLEEETPYWEVYPVGGDTARCDMKDVESLLKNIEQGLEEKKK